MRLTWTLLASITLSATYVAATPAKRHHDTHNYYVLEHTGESGTRLEDVAKTLGVEVVEQAGELQDTWLVRTPKPRISARDEGFDPVIAAFEDLQQKASSHLASRSEDSKFAREVVSSVTFLERQIPRELVKRAPPSIRRPTPVTAAAVAKRLGLKDPLFTEQWHLVNDEFPENMMNVTPVWDMGFTGKGVLTSFLDDGLDFNSDDLKDAFVGHHF
jgi:kexin